MRPLDLLRLSAGALRGHRLRSGLCLLGVTIGVASVILLTSLGEGALRYVSGEFTALGSNLVILLPGKTETTGMAPIFGGVPNDLTLEDAEAILRRVPRVRRVAPLQMGEAPARYGSIRRDITVMATTADYRRIRQIEMRLGRYLPESASTQAQRVCVIGSKVQQELFAGMNPLGEDLRLGDRQFRIIGVMAPRGMSIGVDMDELVHVPVRSGMKMFNRSGLFRVLIEANTHDDIEAVKQGAVEIVTERHHGVEDVTALTQDALLSTFSRILVTLTATLGGIAAVSLSVAGIGIMNVMLVAVSERTSEVGLLKALGASRGQILAVFLLEAAILSASGGVLGLAVGFLLDAAFVELYPKFPIAPPAWAVYLAVAVSILVGVIFGALPARRASRLDPVSALARR